MIVYKATNLLNNKSYIGITKFKLNKRISQHKYCANTNNSYFFHRALNKYGFNNFKFEILLYCENSFAEYYEKELIRLFDSNNSEKGYNLTTGGEKGYKITNNKPIKSYTKGRFGADHPAFGHKHSKESKIKIAESKIGNRNPMFGKIWSEERKDYQRKKIIGIKRDQEFKRKCRENNTGIKNHSYRFDLIDEDLIKLRNIGMTYQQIADRVNASARGVYKRINGY